MRQLVDAFYRERSLANHHIMSYNDFTNHWLQEIIDNIKVGDEEAERGTIQTDIEGYEVKLGKIRVGNPIVKEADGSTRLLTPMEARLRNLTYEAPMYLEFIPIIEGVEHEPEEVRIGDMPIMVRSSRCNITKENLEKHEGTQYTWEEYIRRIMQLQEDPLDPGGYFIINGTERVLISLEDLAPNRVLVEFNKRYGREVPVAKVFSQREGYRALVIVEMKKDSTLMVSVPAASGQIPLVVLLRSLGMERDEEIMDAVVTEPEMMPFVLSNIEDSVQEHGVSNMEEAVAFLGKKLAGGQAKEYRVKRVESLMDRSLLPHLGNNPQDRMKKAVFLGRMARSVLELSLNKIPEDDKDHYANKRLKLAGDLMEDLFRVAFTGLIKDLKYQLERAHSRNRELKVSTAVRSDVLSQRLLHALATGNWVGGRAGVSQLLDRTCNLSALSHLRRVISPLTRSQPHFEARDLHPTQWGRLCPNETPEGPNCGLVKNMAMMTEISEGYDEDEIKDIVKDLGVKEIPSRLIAISTTEVA
ncbi:MAG: DNA-directed RNA polymerase subunit B'' [Methanobacteriota archaeon]